MIPFKKISLAVAVGGLMAAGGAQAATTSFNLYELTTENGFRLADMPMYGFSAGDNGALNNTDSGGSLPDGDGTAAGRLNAGNWTSTVPNYTGGLPATWYEVLGATDSDTVTSAELIEAGVTAIGALTVGSKAYQDWSNAAKATNWGHNADFALLTLTGDADVTITMSSDNGSGLRSGFSVWSGWETAGGTRHTTWLTNGAPALSAGAGGAVFPSAQSMDFTGYNRPATNLGDFVGTAWTSTADGEATLTLTNLAAGNYTIIMGGFCGRAGDVSSGSTEGFCGTGQALQYKMTFSSTAAAPVPIPAAVWLFGSALAGLGVIGRRKNEPAA